MSTRRQRRGAATAGRFVPRLMAVAALAVAVLVGGCRNEPADTLPALGADITQTSTSGISSGAYMAGQFQIAHSKIVIGAAVIAGGPYGCAESLFADMMPGPGTAFLNLSKAINGCMLNALQLWGVPNPRLLADRVRRLAEQGRIDSVEHLLRDRVYLFSGREDRTVVPPIVTAAAEFYRELGLPAESLHYVRDKPAGHAFVTEDKGDACNRSGKPYVVDCDYDQAGALLTHIYGPLQPHAAALGGSYREFDQRPFTRELGGDHGLSDFGVVYVPRACQSGGCRIHIAFHGCAQNRAAVGDTFVTDTGFARWADTNKLIVLFPQTASAAFNPQGCWDWWGYTGRAYLTREGPQIEAVHRMLRRLGSQRVS
ncbi:MAG: poly(3-hydroxybutyrate) depolymerase [Hyphomicrobium sp.]